MDHLRRIFYVSRADPLLDGLTVKNIVFKAQRVNRQMDVTGVLAHSGRHFAQVLEGTAENLAVLTARIEKDQRHAEVTVLFDEPISRRDYADWSMGFLYDATLCDEVEEALMSGSAPQAPARDDTLARRIFLHISDLARP